MTENTNNHSSPTTEDPNGFGDEFDIIIKFDEQTGLSRRG